MKVKRLNKKKKNRLENYENVEKINIVKEKKF